MTDVDIFNHNKFVVKVMRAVSNHSYGKVES